MANLIRLSWSTRIFVTLAVAAVLSFSSFVCVRRQDALNAYSAWRHNPTPATKALMDSEFKKNRQIALEAQAEVTVVLFLVFNAAWEITVRIRRAVTRHRGPQRPPQPLAP